MRNKFIAAIGFTIFTGSMYAYTMRDQTVEPFYEEPTKISEVIDTAVTQKPTAASIEEKLVVRVPRYKSPQIDVGLHHLDKIRYDPFEQMDDIVGAYEDWKTLADSYEEMRITMDELKREIDDVKSTSRLKNWKYSDFIKVHSPLDKKRGILTTKAYRLSRGEMKEARDVYDSYRLPVEVASGHSKLLSEEYPSSSVLEDLASSFEEVDQTFRTQDKEMDDFEKKYHLYF